MNATRTTSPTKTLERRAKDDKAKPGKCSSSSSSASPLLFRHRPVSERLLLAAVLLADDAASLACHHRRPGHRSHRTVARSGSHPAAHDQRSGQLAHVCARPTSCRRTQAARGQGRRFESARRLAGCRPLQTADAPHFPCGCCARVFPHLSGCHPAAPQPTLASLLGVLGRAAAPARAQ